MDSQSPLFHEDFNDALRSAVKALAPKIDAVARDLWPTKSGGGRYLADCLNPEREAKLGPDDVIAILRMCRDRGIHWAMYQLCDAVGYKHPEIAQPKSPNQLRAERMAALLAEFKHLADEEAAEKAAVPPIRGLR